jgi:dihydrofolate reductase
MMELIVACSKGGVIGDAGKLPWYLPEDLQFFKKMTEGQIVMMGRKTFENLPKRPLPNRINIVITREPEKYTSEPDLYFCKLENYPEVLQKLEHLGRRTYVIGGAEIYRIFLPICKLYHITVIDINIDGDARFPMDLEQFETEIHDNRRQPKYKKISYTDILQSKTGLQYQQLCYRREPA